MPMPAVDLTGHQFGYLTVLHRCGTTEGTRAKRATWTVQCVCGKEFTTIGQNLRGKDRGPKKSCGCRRGEMLVEAWGTHGMTGHPAYISWRNMRLRCSDPKDKDWRNYGARGIQFCASWASFDNFWADMGPTWADGLTLERQNVNGNYEANNCKWADRKTQANNRREHVYLDTPAGRMNVTQAAEHYGLKRITLAQRLLRGWPMEKALGLPARGYTTL